MSKKIFRIFWSLDILKTEKWLTEMASKGYILKEINFRISIFKFEEGIPVDNKVYKIYRNRKGIKLLTSSLVESGWENVFVSGEWSVVENINNYKEIKLYPSRDSIIKRNKIIIYILGGLITYFMLVPGLLFAIFTASAIFSTKPVEVTYMPGAIAARIGMISSALCIIYIILKLNNCNKKIRGESTINLNYETAKNEVLDCKTEEILIKSSKIIKKRKIAWFYAPDKLENYLEEMESKGNNLYRVSKLGTTFYFIRGEAKKVSYFIDCQKTISDSYYELNKQDGWVRKFTSSNMFNKNIIWAKNYTDEKPELYSDKEHILKAARNRCIVNVFATIIIIGLYIKSMEFRIEPASYNFQVDLFLPIIQIILIAEFLYFTFLSVWYYARTKKTM